MRGGTKVNATTGTEMTPIVTRGAVVMSASAIVETMGSAGGSVPLIDVREAMSVG